MAESFTSYADSGVIYPDMDPFKIACQQAGATTEENIERFNELGLQVKAISNSRGESSFRTRVQPLKLIPYEIAHLIEGLGSLDTVAKHLLDRSRYLLTQDIGIALAVNEYFEIPGHDNVSTVVNDESSSGASPIGFSLFVAAGDSKTFTDEQKYRPLIKGTASGCDESGCTWEGGETQTLIAKIYPDEMVFAGAVYGLIFPEHTRYPSQNNLREGLSIVFLETDNPQTNGYTPLRGEYLNTIAQRMGLSEARRLDAYTYDIGNGQTYGDAILGRSLIATPIIDELLLHPTNPTPIEYISHISGHGWTKIMRSEGDFTYVIDKVPEPHPVFKFIQEVSRMSTRQMYKTYNMGAYYTLFMEPQYVDRVLEVAQAKGQRAMLAGYVEEGPKQVIIRPIQEVFNKDDLIIR
jgi:phosphoribosylformylglycinamidine cyclo-ligase